MIITDFAIIRFAMVQALRVHSKVLGLNNNRVKLLHFPHALTGLLPGSNAREQARKVCHELCAFEFRESNITQIDDFFSHNNPDCCVIYLSRFETTNEVEAVQKVCQR
jgi:hypothetical protein